MEDSTLLKTIILSGAAALALAAAAHAQTPPQPGPALPTPDFITAAAQTDEFERQEGRMAETQAGDPHVKEFGHMMTIDHADTTRKLRAAIAKAGLPEPPPPPLTAEQQQMIDALRGVTGEPFDKMYLGQQIQTHEMALHVMQSYAANGDNAVLREAASNTVPVVEHHLAVARQLREAP
jgi:putative membrane protein